MIRFSLPITLLLLALVLAIPTNGQDSYQNAVVSIDTDLEKAIQELAALRKKIAAEKPDIARAAAESAAELRTAKRKGEIAKVSRLEIEDQLRTAESQLKLWRSERIYLDNILSEFSKNYQSTVLIPEADSLKKKFADTSSQSSIDQLFHLIDQLPQMGKVRTIEGTALNPEGTVAEGTFAIAGPVAWFTDKDGSLNGLTTESRSLQAEVIPGIAKQANITNLIEGQSSTIAFDPTLGNAIAMRDIQSFNLISIIKKGGMWIYPILALAALALFAAIAKWFQLVGIRKLQLGVVGEVVAELSNQNTKAASALASNVKHPVRKLLEAGIASSDQPVDDVEESLYQKYLEVLPRLQKGLPLIAIASATAPLLGLLGTVTGMIKTFELINIFGSGDAQTLSGGISEALITTAFGLIVAIPALILHAVLSRKVNGVRSDMEVASLSFINEMKNRIATRTWKPST